VDGCEILHQLIDGRNAIIYRVSNILLVVQDFFHQQYFSNLVVGFNPSEKILISWENKK